MIEAEWLVSTDPKVMLQHLRSKASNRKLRLFACACCDLAWEFIADDRNRPAIELAGRLADGAEKPKEIAAVRASTRDSTAWCAIMDSAWDAASYASRSGADAAARAAIRSPTWDGIGDRNALWWQARAEVGVTQAGILRDIFGNPFATVPVNPAWQTTTVAQLAQVIYEEWTFVGLPILADALEEAGCTDAAILTHLRGPGPHVRGCWVVDLLLGKE